MCPTWSYVYRYRRRPSYKRHTAVGDKLHLYDTFFITTSILTNEKKRKYEKAWRYKAGTSCASHTSSETEVCVMNGVTLRRRCHTTACGVRYKSLQPVSKARLSYSCHTAQRRLSVLFPKRERVISLIGAGADKRLRGALPYCCVCVFAVVAKQAFVTTKYI